MAEALEKMLSFPSEKTKKGSAKDYDKEITAYLNTINKIPTAAWIKKVDKKSLLDMLDPAVNSIAYLFALTEEMGATPSSQSAERVEDFVERAQLFFTSFDPVQVRYAGKEWRDLWEWLAEMLIETKTPDVSVLVTALLRLDPSAGTLTSLHLNLLHVALTFGVPSQILPVLDRNIYAFPSHNPKSVGDDLLSEEPELSNTVITDKSGLSKKLDSQSVLEYYLLGGTIYLGLRNYNRARLFFEYVLLSPVQAQSQSVFQVDAYKRWLLTGLCAQGAPFAAPRTLDAATARNIKACCKAYEALADDFAKRNAKKFHAELDVGLAVWEEDGNLALVGAAQSSFHKYRISDLSKTFAALPVARVASQLEMDPADTLQLLQKLIEDHQLDASLSGSDDATVLRFQSVQSPADVANGDTIEEQTLRIQRLVTSVRDADRRLQLTKEYVEWNKRNKRLGAADGDLAEAMDLTWDNPTVVDDDGDEDIMA